MNYGEINQMLDMLLGESSTAFFTQQDRKMAINQACKTIAGAADFLRHTQEFTATTDVGSYILPGSFRQMGDGIDLVDDSGGYRGLKYASISQLRDMNPNWETASGMPTHYTLENSNVYLFPTPNAPVRVRINYQPTPNVLVNDTDVPFYGALRAEPYHDAIAYYAAYLLAFKDKDYELVAAMLRLYTERLVDLREELRNVGGPIRAFIGDTYRKDNS